MNIINPKKLKIIEGLPPKAVKGDKVSWDTEFFGQEKSRLHRPHGIFAFLGCTFDGKTVYFIKDKDKIQEFLNLIDDAVWIGHHFKYDITQLRRFAYIPQRKRLWDTMLIEQIMYSGYYNEFSLADVARRRLDLYLPKETRKEFSEQAENTPKVKKSTRKNAPAVDGNVGGDGENVSALPVKEIIDIRNVTREQIEYAAVDVVATFQVYQSQRAEIEETDLEIWKSIELPFMWTLLSMDGIRLDTESWRVLAQKNEKIANDIQGKYGRTEIVQGKRSTKEVFIGLNLNSPKQVKEHFASLGEPVKSTGVEVLEPLSDLDTPAGKFAKELMTYRTYAKRSSTYGEKFITEHVEADGKIYADIYQIGAETARTSCRHPNLQNQPNEFDYRNCFIADEGNCLIVADYSSQEPRIATFFSQDERLIEILNSGKKLYIEIARDVFHKEITKQDDEYGHFKSTILGIFYGMSAYGLSGRLRVSEEEAQDMIDKILQTYPGIQTYIDQQKQAGDYVQSIYGRKIWLNKYDKGWLRGALNYPIQSSAADATKLAASRFLEKWKEYGDYHNQYPLRLLVHDEIVVECEEESADKMKEILEQAMVEVAEEMHEGLKGVAEVFSGNTWACKK